MSAEITPITTSPAQSALMRFSPEQRQLLKDHICRGLDDIEASYFIEVCKVRRLDPFKRQIHGRKQWDSQLGREAMVIITAIDGYRSLAEETGRYRPGREATFEEDKDGRPLKATAYVDIKIDGEWIERSQTVRWSEYVQYRKSRDGGAAQPTATWQRMPHVMLAKCAEAALLRRCFPEQLGGIYTEDEMPDREPAQIAPRFPCEECGTEVAATSAAASKKAHGRTLCQEHRPAKPAPAALPASESSEPSADATSAPEPGVREQIAIVARERGMTKMQVKVAAKRAGVALPEDLAQLTDEQAAAVLEEVRR